jgi:DNA-binding response OmpR family regulator
MTQSRILLIEDERTIIDTIELCLKHEGYRVLQATDGERGLHLAQTEKPDLVILDITLPRVDGLEICRRLRDRQFEAPILMVTGKGQIDDRVTGLNAGADDYLPKPFSARELIARVNALLRRQQRTSSGPRVLELGETRIDLSDKRATRAGQPLALTKTEYGMLELLARPPGRAVSRERMLDLVWGYTRFPTTRTVDTHIWRLRKKIGDDGETPRWIKPVHGLGYCLELSGATPSGESAA